MELLAQAIQSVPQKHDDASYKMFPSYSPILLRFWSNWYAAKTTMTLNNDGDDDGNEKFKYNILL